MLKNVSYPTRASWVWVAAFFCSIPWIGYFDQEFLILTVGLMIASTLVSDIGGVQNRTWSVPFSPVLIAGGLFWLVLAASVFTTQVPFVAWGYFAIFSCMPLTVSFFLVNDGSDVRLRCGLRAVAAALIILSLYAFYQYFFRHDMLAIGSGRVKAPFGDPNALGAMFSFGVFGALAALKLYKEQRRETILSFVFLALCVAGLLLTGSRGAMFAMACFALLFFCLVLRSAKIAAAIAGIFTILVIGSSFSGVDTETGFFNVWRKVFSGGVSLISERFLIWESTLKLIQSHFWTGTGIGTFFLYYPEVRLKGENSAGFMAHNDILQFVAEAGIFAGVAFVMIWLLATVRMIKAFCGSSSEDPRLVKAFAAFCAMGAMTLHSQITFNYYVLPLAIILAFAFAFWYKETAGILGEPQKKLHVPAAWKPDILKAAILLPGILLLFLAVAPIVSQRLALAGLHAAQDNDIVEFSHRVNWADRVAFGLNGQAYVYAAAVPLGILANDKDPMSVIMGEKDLGDEERAKLKVQAQDLLDRAKAVNPRLASVLFYEGWLTNLTIKDRHEADDVEIELLNRALALDPLHLVSRRRLIDLLWSAKRKDEAKQVIYDGLDWAYGGQDPTPFYIQASYIFLQEEDLEGHLKVMARQKAAQENAVPYAPSPLAPNPMAKAIRDVIRGRD